MVPKIATLIEHQVTFFSDLFGAAEKTRFAQSEAVFITCFHGNKKFVDLIAYLWRQIHERERTTRQFYQSPDSSFFYTDRLLLLFILGFQKRYHCCPIFRGMQATLDEDTSQFMHLELMIFLELKGRRQWHDWLLRLNLELTMVTRTCQALQLGMLIAVACLKTIWYGYGRVKEWQVKGYGDLKNLGIDGYSLSHRRSGIDWM